MNKAAHMVELNPWHKRQAALIQHFTSLAYLESILSRAENLIAMADAMLEERAHLDSAGIALANWSQTSTAGHFCVHAYPALVEFRDGLVESIALRAYEKFNVAGENQCSRMLTEYAPSMIWATHEQESAFKAEAESVFRYAGGLSRFTKRPCVADDLVFWLLWNEGHIDGARIPRFVVRTDVVARTGEVPPRTGIYVPQGDAYGALRFAWTGGHGALGSVRSLNEFGEQVLRRVGRQGLWGNAAELYRILDENRHLDEWGWSDIKVDTMQYAAGPLSHEMFTERASEWYLVEPIQGEYEEIDGSYAGAFSQATRQGRIAAGQSVPTSGWWYSPAAGERRYFKRGDVFPAIADSDWGDTFWLWALDQSAPRLG